MRRTVPGRNATVAVFDSYPQAEAMLRRLLDAKVARERVSLVRRGSGAGPFTVAGPLAGWIVMASENAEVFGGLNGLGAALYGLGLARDVVLRYQAEVESGRFLLVVHGSASEVDRARAILDAERQPAG